LKEGDSQRGPFETTNNFIVLTTGSTLAHILGHWYMSEVSGQQRRKLQKDMAYKHSNGGTNAHRHKTQFGKIAAQLWGTL